MFDSRSQIVLLSAVDAVDAVAHASVPPDWLLTTMKRGSRGGWGLLTAAEVETWNFLSVLSADAQDEL